MFKKIFLLLVLPLVLTGCVQTETKLTINKDNSAVYEQKFFVDASLFEGENATLKLDPKREDKKKALEAQTGMKFKEFHEDGKLGLTGTKKIFDLRTDEWNTTLTDNFYKIKTNNEEGKIVDIKKGFFKTDYVIDIEIQPIVEMQKNGDSYAYQEQEENQEAEAQETQENQENAEPQLDENGNPIEKAQETEPEPKAEPKTKTGINSIDEAILSQMRSTYMIKIPTRAFSHNSQNVDTKNLIYRWDLDFKNYVPIKLRYSVYNVINIITMIIIILIALGELFYFALYKKE